MWRWSRAVVLAVLLLPQGPAHAQMTEARFDEAIAANARHRAEMFERYGFQNGSKAAAEGKSLRRIRFMSGPAWIPVVELERQGRRVIMRVAPGSGRIVERPAPPGMWKRLAELDKNAFAPPTFNPSWLNAPRTWSSCHGGQIDLEWIERGRVRSAGGNECAGSIEWMFGAKYAVVGILAEALLPLQPRCSGLTATKPVEALEMCFSARTSYGGDW